MKHLTCHLDRLRACLAQLPDPRRGRNRQYTMQDIGLAALSVFFMQSPSFLAHQRTLAEQRGRSNAHTLFGLTRIPCDNHIRQLLDGVPPDRFDELFQHIVEDLDAAGGLDRMRRLDGRVLIALDGTEYFRSRKIDCPNCSTRQRRDGGVEYFHQVLAATLVAPGHAQALPLPPEFIRPQDGHAKQDCERQAVKRWLRRLGPRYGALRPVYLGDDLYACQPVCEAIRAVGGRFILTCKPHSHETLYEYLHGIALKTHRTVVGRGRQRRTHRYRFMSGLPLRDGEDALRVNWLEIEIARPNGAVTYRNAFVTDLAVNPDTVAELAACGRARWKIENETFNVLKHRGYHLEHNFGHGKKTLASVLVALNLLAFALHGACDLIETLWQRARQRLGSRIRMFEHLRTITCYRVFPSWTALMTLLATGSAPPRPP